LVSGEPFLRVKSVAEIALSVVLEAALWDALVNAVRDTFDGYLPSEQRPFSVIVASDPLLGLATAEALYPGAKLPLREADRSVTRARLPEFLGGFQSLYLWREDIRALGSQTGPLLIRAWDSPADRVAGELVSLAAERDEPPMIYLMKTSPKAHGLQPVADITYRARDIVAATIRRLNILGEMTGAPHRSAAQWIDAFIASGVTLDRILAALNTAKHHDFYQLAWTEERRLSPLPAERVNTFILHENEEKPRHAASLFLAAHFPELTPGQFVDLADALASHTPASTPGNHKLRPPVEVTDLVLRQCRIHFVPDQRGGYVAVIGADAAEAADPNEYSGSEVGSMASDFRRLFERDAALLKERYLTALAMRATLGHASEAVADRYRELEIEAMRAAAALDPEAARERLRRIVFGYPVFLRATDGYLAANRRGLESMLRRAVSRTPRLIEELAARVASFQPGEALRALCEAEPVDTDADWPRLFREACARLFWLVYTGMPEQVSLSDYTAFVGRGGASSADEARLRREEALNALRIAFDNPEEDPLLAPFGDKRKNTTLLTALLHAVAREFPRLYYRQNQPFAATLFGEIALQYVLWGLRGKRWHSLPPWPDDVTLARALELNGRMDAWCSPARRVETRYADRTAAEGAVHAEGRLSWLTCILMLDGLVASASFGDELESYTWNVFYFHHIKLAPKDTNLDLSSFSSPTEWELLCLPDPDEESALGTLPARLLRMFPVLLLMAATRDPASPPDEPRFVFSGALKDFLRQAKGRADEAWVDELRDAVREGKKIQNEWGEAVNGWVFPRPALNDWRPAFRARVNALAAFQRALDPLRREIGLRPVAGAAAAGSGAEAPADPRQPAEASPPPSGDPVPTVTPTQPDSLPP
jgi:hypothetical protein